MVKGYDPTTTDPSKLVLEYLIRWSTSERRMSLEESQKLVKEWLRKSPSTSSIYKKFGKEYDKKQEEIQSYKKGFFEKPTVVIKKSCHSNRTVKNVLGEMPKLQRIYFDLKKGLHLSSSFPKAYDYEPSVFDQKFPSYSNIKGGSTSGENSADEIVLCLDQIRNKVELKENLDRQLTILQRLKLQELAEQKTMSPNTFASQTERNEETDKRLMKNLYEGCVQGYKNYMLESEKEQKISKKCAKMLFYRRSTRQMPWDIKFRYASKLIDEIVL